MTTTIRRLAATAAAAATLSLGLIALPATAAPAQAADYAYCFVSITNQVWCYRYNCTAAEEFSGCYPGWVIMDSYWNA
jgi:hypothetical protein